MLSEKHVYFDVINTHTRCMLLYVDTYSGVKCAVFINLTQNVHTGRPRNALPSSTQSCYNSTTVQQNISAVTVTASYSLRVATNFGDSAIDRCCFLFRFFLYCGPVSAELLTPNSLFSMKAEPQFLTGIFLNSGP